MLCLPAAVVTLHRGWDPTGRCSLGAVIKQGRATSPGAFLVLSDGLCSPGFMGLTRISPMRPCV